MKTIGYVLLILFLVTITSIRFVNPKQESKPDPPSKICTLKLNDANDTTSYISGPNVNE